jgi:predicted MPP superfamily phosphohydrolase
VTGDFITGRLREAEAYREVLRLLPATAPTVAIAGNHDGGSWARRRGGYENHREVFELLEQAGITGLHNRHHDLEINGQPLTLVGLGDLWSNNLKPGKAFDGVRKEEGRILVALSHNPDSKEELAGYPWDLLLCGHTHGGQMHLPFLGTPFAPVRDHRYVMGLHAWKGRWIHISKGVGNLHGIRINCRPEVSILRIGGRRRDEG